MARETNRNKVTQIIINPKTKERKKIYHDKKMPGGDFKSWWRELNRMPKKL